MPHFCRNRRSNSFIPMCFYSVTKLPTSCERFPQFSRATTRRMFMFLRGVYFRSSVFFFFAPERIAFREAFTECSVVRLIQVAVFYHRYRT